MNLKGSVLVALDFSKESALACKFAASLAEKYGSKLYVLHVLRPYYPHSRAEISDFLAFEQSRVKQGEKDLSRVLPRAVKERVSVEEILALGQPVHRVIVEKAEKLSVDLIVIATHGRTGLAHVLLGSVAEHVIRYASCPVLVIRNSVVLRRLSQKLYDGNHFYS